MVIKGVKIIVKSMVNVKKNFGIVMVFKMMGKYMVKLVKILKV